MATAKAMTDLYERESKTVSKYVHATSRGHEAIQIATGILLQNTDYLSPYYRDDALLLSIGMTPYQMMLQVMAKRDDPFSGGRIYYAHPSLKDDDKPTIPYQSSATGMQAIPITGAAMGIQYKEKTGLSNKKKTNNPIAICSIGDAAMTEGEVSEALQMAALKQLPILYLVQDNGWDISAKKEETRAMDASQYAKGFSGIESISIDGSDFLTSYLTMKKVIGTIRRERRPFLVHARVPLLNHHTSGVRMEWYRDDLDLHKKRDPLAILEKIMIRHAISKKEIDSLHKKAIDTVEKDYKKALKAPDPIPDDLYNHDFVPTPITQEKGTRTPKNGETKVMVDCGLHAVKELMADHPECLLYGQDVGRRLGGVFREAATLAETYGDNRVFNTPIQEAFIVGSTAGMSAAGLRPIVEVQFADYLWPGLNQLFAEVSRSCYLSNGKFPVSMVLRVPIGAYGSGGPFHSSSIESVLTNIIGIKIAYPSTGADLKGLLKAAYYDPNPVVILEHKGLYWSKIKGTDYAQSIMPDKDYILPLGKGLMIKEATNENKTTGNSVLVVCYGMGVHWAMGVSTEFEGQMGILDLRTLAPIDEELVYKKAKEYSRIMVITEEPENNGFAQSLAARIQQKCWEYLDAPVTVMGSENLPAIPLNEVLEKTMILNPKKIKIGIEKLLKY